MNLTQLKEFKILAEKEHYTKAADELNIAQSSLSRSMAALEHELGVYLFEKKGRGVVLTREGRTFYDHVDKSLQELELGIREVREAMDPRRGTVDFGFIYALSSGYIPELLKSFLAGEENQGIRFRFYQGNSRKLLPQIRDDSIDLGITSFMEDYPDLEFVPVIHQEYVLVCSADHPLASFAQVTLKDAAAYDFVMPLDRTNYVESLFAAEDLKPRITGQVEEDIAAAALVSIGMGLAILPRNRMLDGYGVKQLSFSPQPLFRDFYLVKRKGKHLSPAADRFYHYISRKGTGTSRLKM